MPKVSDAMLLAYLDGALTPKERAAVDAALQSDPALRAALDALRQEQLALRSLFDAVHTLPLPRDPALAARLASRRPAPRLARPLAALCVLALVLAAFVAHPLWVDQSASEPPTSVAAPAPISNPAELWQRPWTTPLSSMPCSPDPAAAAAAAQAAPIALELPLSVADTLIFAPSYKMSKQETLYGAPITWRAPSGYAGPLLIRARNAQSGDPVPFNVDYRLTEYVFVPKYGGRLPDGARGGVMMPLITTPGCFVIQVDGDTFSYAFAFQGTLDDASRPYEPLAKLVKHPGQLQLFTAGRPADPAAPPAQIEALDLTSGLTSDFRPAVLDVAASPAAEFEARAQNDALLIRAIPPGRSAPLWTATLTATAPLTTPTMLATPDALYVLGADPASGLVRLFALDPASGDPLAPPVPLAPRERCPAPDLALVPAGDLYALCPTEALRLATDRQAFVPLTPPGDAPLTILHAPGQAQILFLAADGDVVVFDSTSDAFSQWPLAYQGLSFSPLPDYATLSADGRWLAVARHATDPTTLAEGLDLFVFDTSTQTLRATIFFQGRLKPATLALSADGAFLYAVAAAHLQPIASPSPYVMQWKVDAAAVGVYEHIRPVMTLRMRP